MIARSTFKSRRLGFPTKSVNLGNALKQPADAQLGIEVSKLKEGSRAAAALSATLKESPTQYASWGQRRCNRFKPALRRNGSVFCLGRVNAEVVARQLHH